MSPKLKSLLFLSCFVLCSLVYYYIEENENKESILQNENFATMEMIDMNESDNLNSDLEVVKEKE